MNLKLFFTDGALHVTRFNRHSRIRLISRTRHLSALALALGLLLGSTASLQAREKKDLDIVLSARTVMVDQTGRELLVEADAAPGDIVEYRAIFVNAGAKPLRHLEPTLPIPDGMAYLPAASLPAPHLASLDGKKFEPVPLILERGVELFIEVPPAAYRALRWQVTELAPGETITVTARARVTGTP